jgi:hypothetical protein
MPSFPKKDLPETFPSDIELRMQSPKTFEEAHRTVERGNYFYTIAHKAMALGANTLEVESLQQSASLGFAAYEIVGGFIDPQATYASVDDQMRVVYGAQKFLADITTGDDFSRKLAFARDRLEADTPALHATLHEVVGSHVKHDKVAIQFALGGAGIARAMQIYVDRLEVVE